MATPPPEGAILEEKPQLPTSLEKVTADSALPSGDTLLDIKTAPVKPDPVISEINHSAVHANMAESTAPVNGHSTTEPVPAPATNGIEVEVEVADKKEDIAMANASPPTSPPKIDEQQTSFSEVPSSLDTVTKTTTVLSIAESGETENKTDTKLDDVVAVAEGQNGITETAPQENKPEPSAPAPASAAEVGEKPQVADAMELSTDKPQESVNDDSKNENKNKDNIDTNTSKEEVPDDQKIIPEQKEHPQQPTDTATLPAPTPTVEPEKPTSENPEEMAKLRSQGLEDDSGTNATSDTPNLQQSTTEPAVEKPPPVDESMADAPVSNLAQPTTELAAEKPALVDESMTEAPVANIQQSTAEPAIEKPAPVDESMAEAPVVNIQQPTAEPAVVEKPAPVEESMSDAPVSSSKPQRERDEDPGDERAAKRTKTNGGEPIASGFKIPPSLPPPATNGTPSPEKSSAITPVRHTFLMRTMSKLKRLHDSKFFREPVDIVKSNVPNYYEIIKRPMDLRTIETTLKEDKYSSVDAFVNDVNTMVQNSVTFNGEGHVVSQQGLKLKAKFEGYMATLPGADEVDPTPADKKKKSNRAPTKNAPARREPRQTASNAKPAAAPTNTASSKTFALGPEGVPLIRRDSTAADGRPKRSIHPPKNRELPYSAKPKKKKFQWELKFCQEVLNELHRQKHYFYASPFYAPVDPVALNIPTYHSVIKRPMDLSTVQTKLHSGQYENAKEMEADVRQIFKNCYKFNIQGDPTYTAGKKTEEVFDAKWAQKNRWIETHEPPSARQSVGSSDEESDDNGAAESEDDQDDEKLTLLQKQIAEMSRQVEAITRGKKKTPPAPSKKPNKSKPSGRKDSRKAANTSSSAPANKKKGSKGGKPEKQRWITYHEKQLISNGISSLSDKKMQEALRIIQNNVPSLKGVQETEIELDIDELPNEVLLMLLRFVKKHAPAVVEEEELEPTPPPTAAPSRPKKNKPMSKYEQEAQINMLQGSLSRFQGGSGQSPDPVPSVEAHAESSGDDDDDSEESEEE